jgi:UDP-perosamine 4-acetyltransferase
VLGVPVLGGDELLSELANAGVEYFVIGLGSTSDNMPRRRLYERASGCRLKPFTVIHPTAFVSKRAEVGDGAQLCPGSLVNAKAVLGVNVIVNTGAIVEHDCVLGDHVHVATGARLASTVSVGICAHIGAGATIKQCVSIGEESVIGAGAVVIKDVPARTTVVGVPASPLVKRDKP